MDMGYLVPVYCEKIVPGDKFKKQHEFLLRMAPFANQVFQGFHTTVDYFFVPSRILWQNFESFLSKGVNGDSDIVHPYLELKNIYNGQYNYVNTLIDYFNLPTETFKHPDPLDASTQDGAHIDALPFFAYLKVFLDYYIDENLIPDYLQPVIERLLNAPNLVQIDGNMNGLLSEYLSILHDIQGDDSDGSLTHVFKPLRRAYPKDYFTSALPFAQRGPIVQIPLNGEGEVRMYTRPYDGASGEVEVQKWRNVAATYRQPATGSRIDEVEVTLYNHAHGISFTSSAISGQTDYPGSESSGSRGLGIFEEEYFSGDPSASDYVKREQAALRNRDANSEGGSVLNTPITFRAVNVNGTATITDLRTASAVQNWLEKNARAGVRYKEQLAAHFGVRSRDYRLDRAELLARYRSTIQIGETFTTSANRDGTFVAGMGVSNATGSQATNSFKHYFEEHGYLIGIMSVIPTPAYFQGIPRQFQELDVFDYFWPEFQHIGEQEIKGSELYFDDSDEVNNTRTFGYTPRYAQYKARTNQIHGDFRTSLNFMHAARAFAQSPLLNGTFINVDVDNDDLYRVFNNTTELANSSPIYVDIYHKVTAVRPMSYFGTPRIL